MSHEQALWGLLGIARDNLAPKAFKAFLLEMAKKMVGLAAFMQFIQGKYGREPTVEEVWDSWFEGTLVTADPGRDVRE